MWSLHSVHTMVVNTNAKVGSLIQKHFTMWTEIIFLQYIVFGDLEHTSTSRANSLAHSDISRFRSAITHLHTQYIHALRIHVDYTVHSVSSYHYYYYICMYITTQLWLAVPDFQCTLDSRLNNYYSICDVLSELKREDITPCGHLFWKTKMFMVHNITLKLSVPHFNMESIMHTHSRTHTYSMGQKMFPLHRHSTVWPVPTVECNRSAVLYAAVRSIDWPHTYIHV